MKDLQARLEQARRDKKLAIESADAEIKAIQKELGREKNVYSIGDRFLFHSSDESHKVILATDGRPYVVMVSITSGERWVNSITKVKRMTSITQAEFDKICHNINFVRYWDNKKERKV